MPFETNPIQNITFSMKLISFSEVDLVWYAPYQWQNNLKTHGYGLHCGSTLCWWNLFLSCPVLEELKFFHDLYILSVFWHLLGLVTGKKSWPVKKFTSAVSKEETLGHIWARTWP